jgi:hypothetical protein
MVITSHWNKTVHVSNCYLKLGSNIYASVTASVTGALKLMSNNLMSENIGVDFKNHKNLKKCFNDFLSISLNVNLRYVVLITCMTNVGHYAGCYSHPRGICETANDVVWYVVPFNKGGMAYLRSLTLLIIVYPTPKLVPHVLYGVFVGRNCRPRHDVDAFLGQENVSCIRSTRLNWCSILCKTITYRLSRDPQPLSSYRCWGKAIT